MIELKYHVNNNKKIDNRGMQTRACARVMGEPRKTI